MRCICTILVFLFLNYQEYCPTSKISEGMGRSQSMFCFQRSCIMHFGSIKAGVRMPDGSKIEFTKLSIPCFILGTSLFIALIHNTSCSWSRNIPDICSVAVWYKSKLTDLFFDGNSCVLYFRISWLFEINLGWIHLTLEVV